MSKHNQKGTVLEQVVASLHNAQGAQVQTNVRLPAVGNPKRKREIDVLLIAYPFGYPSYFAIECKNHDNVIGAKEIDAFIGKLQDVNMPCQQGIFVAREGYTKGAVERGKKAGLNLLTIHGLSKDGLSSLLRQAVQSVMYVIPEVLQITVANTNDTFSVPQDMLFFDDSGEAVGAVPDLIWHAWDSGEIPSELGERHVDLIVPDGWFQLADGEKQLPLAVSAQVLVRGCVITLDGAATEHLLLKNPEQTLQKLQTVVTFDTSQTKYPLLTFGSEAEWETYWSSRPEPVKLAIGRIRVPRIRLGSIYWPPSRKAQVALAEFLRVNGRDPLDKEKLTEFMTTIEGDDLSAAWDEF